MNKLIFLAVTLLLLAFASAEFSLFEEEFYSIDLLAAKCRAPRWRAEGQTCGANAAEANYTSNCYIQGLTCNNTGTDNTCMKIVSYGKTCKDNNDCLGYSCLGLKCGVLLGYGESCSSNDQCASKWCLSGMCAANMTGQGCATNNDCKFFNADKLYCYAANKTCSAMGKQGEMCSATILCEPSLSCVKPGSNSEGTCQARAAAGADCDVLGANGKPQCVANANCINNKCAAFFSGTDGAKCQSGMDCGPGLACNKTGSADGQCKPEGVVKCDVSNGFSVCRPMEVGGFCSCPMGPEMEGVCATNSAAPAVVCSTEKINLENCKMTKCDFGGRGGSFFYGTNYCYATNCKLQSNAYNCCLKSKFTGWVPAPEFTDAECVVPGESKPPATNSPSSASTLIISTAVVVASVVALLA